MGETIFNLKPAPTEADAERLVEAVEHVTGVTDATVDTATRRLFVTFDPMHAGDIELEKVLKREGFSVATEDEVGLETDTPGYTREAEVMEQNQATATTMTRDQEIDVTGGG
ncbi:MAG TPA: hypothetical protein V6D05_01010, partial [Stenomitos sp.]